MVREAIRRLWLIATCTHINRCLAMVFEDTTEIRFCTRCGTLVRFADEGTIRHNPHRRWTEVAGIHEGEAGDDLHP
jgi:hypothetical protein